MAGRVIQGFFIGGRMRPLVPALRAAVVQRAMPAGAARPVPGPPTPAFAGRAEAVQKKSAPGRPPLVHAAAQVTQRFGGNASFEIDPAAIGLARGGGKPLPEALLAKMEAAFGADFSAVRVHVGPQASRIGAVAFTTGNDLYFAPGHYQPEAIKGQQLIGHELAHVVQQREGRVRASGSGLAVVQDRMLEAEADRLGTRAAAYAPIVQRAVTPLSFSAQRSRKPGPPVHASGHPRPIQRMLSDSEYEDSDVSDFEDDDIEEEVLIANSASLPQWRNAAAQGYRDAWWEAIADEAAQANPAITANVARGMVGNPSAARILHIQGNPPNDHIIDDAQSAAAAGENYGRGLGYTEGANEAYRICGWLRGNYPAIPALRSVAALAQNGGICVYCNVNASTQVDHVYPVQKHWITLGYQGANLASVNDASNLVGSCQPCNGSKSNHYLNNWNGKAWAHNQWFPWGPPGALIPARRGAAIALGHW